jgi:hypothetical protein
VRNPDHARQLASRFPHLEPSELRECDAVAYAAFEHMGKGYRITRELWPDVIDCSSLVSQSHWTGAGIQTPFIAETQRFASNARVIEPAELLPGDAIYAYRSKSEAPGGRHNHVALFLGTDQMGKPWAIESREETGVTLSELNKIRFDGGIRRFCIEPLRVFPQGTWSQLARRVPKLGRLGARLTASYAGGPRRHHGTDVYVDEDCYVTSPLGGTIVATFKTHSSSGTFIGVSSSRVCSLVGPVSTVSEFRIGQDLDEGEVLGTPSWGAGPGGCNTIPNPPGTVRLHWELWAEEGEDSSPARDLRCGWLPDGFKNRLSLSAQNPIYSLKQGSIGSCVVLST